MGNTQRQWMRVDAGSRKLPSRSYRRQLRCAVFFAASWLLATACASSGASAIRTLRLTTMNDFHGALYERPLSGAPGRSVGGLPWLVSAVRHIRAEWPDTLVLDGGDLFQGTLPVNASQGMGSVAALGLAGVDAAAIGNHEFDYGPRRDGAGHPLRGALEHAAVEAPFQWLAANIVERGSLAEGRRWQPEGLAPWTIVERSGVRVGLIGLTTAETPQTTLAVHVADLEFEDPVAALRRDVPRMRAAGAEVIVALGHLTGSCPEAGPLSPTATCLPAGEIGRILTELPRGTVDVLVAGHAHSLMAFRWDDTFVLEAGSRGDALARLELAVGPEGALPDESTLHPLWMLEHESADPGCSGEPFPARAIAVGGVELAPAADAIALVQELESRAENRCDAIGCVSAPMTRAHQAESILGDYVADVIRSSMPNVDIAIQNSGGLRADWAAGPLRLGHVYEVMPFDNALIVVELTGERVLELFRIGTSGAHGVLQVAGAQVHFDPEVAEGVDRNGDGTVEAWERNRLCSLMVEGAPIDPTRTYRVATTDFLYDGGDHLGEVFAGAPIVHEGPLLRDALRAAIQAAPGCVDDGRALGLPAPRIIRAACPSRSGRE